MGFANDDVQRKRWIDGEADLHGLIELISARMITRMSTSLSA
jgi:hypothetical protein